MGEKRAERIANETAWIQRRLGKKFRIVGGLKLSTFIGLRREISDIDVYTLEEGNFVPPRTHTKHRRPVLGVPPRDVYDALHSVVPRTVIERMDTYFHPIYAKLAWLRPKDVDDLLRVYEVWKKIKERSSLAADLYLDDIAFAIAASARRDPGNRMFSLDPREALPKALKVLTKYYPEAAEFYRRVFARALCYLPTERAKVWRVALKSKNK